MQHAQGDDASALSHNEPADEHNGNDDQGAADGVARPRIDRAPSVLEQRLAMRSTRLLLQQQLDNERLIARLSLDPGLSLAASASMGLLHQRSQVFGLPLPPPLNMIEAAAGAPIADTALLLGAIQRSQLLEQQMGAQQQALSMHASLVAQGFAVDPATRLWLSVGATQQPQHAPQQELVPAAAAAVPEAASLSGRLGELGIVPSQHMPAQRSEVNSYNDPQLASMTQKFPVKLYRLILEAQEYHHGEIIIFSPTGEGFLMLDRDAFMSLLAPRYFRLHSIASFRRQLYLYGFVKCAHQGRKGYTHPGFRRDRPDLLCTIRRRYDYDFRKRRSVDVKVDSP